jgi:DNA modification methylase
MSTPVRVHCADWLAFVRTLARGSVDLVYADPPFNTGKTQSDRSGSFDDRFSSVDEHSEWLRERLGATIPALRQTGSVLVHVDWRTSHRVRCLLDELLGADHFVNHLVWSYGLGGSSARRFARKHDDILFYSIDPGRYYFEAPMVPATSARMKGRMKKSTDVVEIPSINNMAVERTGYPTQKPLALLELLVKACCPPGGCVLDPCCGSGTALVAAGANGRDAIGCDINPEAVAVARERLERMNAGKACGA